MPQQEYIKYLYEKEECSIAEISAKVGINWRTAAKYANKGDWNKNTTKQNRRRPVMEPYADIVDIWIMEDMLKPRKERRTAVAIYNQLKSNHNFEGSGRTVRYYVSQRKKELRAAREEKFLELEHPPGQAQVDFGTTHVIWEQKLKEIKYLAFSFPYSNAGFCVPVPSENTQCFLHAINQVFDWIGGVPEHIRFDNLSAAVISVGEGEQRVLTETFTRFILHHRFKAEFCNKGKGNEKGNVENKVGYTRRNWLLPYPEVLSFEQLTKELYERALEDLNRPHYARGISMAELWEDDKKVLLPLPTVAFEPVEIDTARVNKFGKFTTCGEVYNVPGAVVGETVLLKLWWDRVEVLDHSQKCLCSLPRQYTLKTQPIDWKGYFNIYVKKPRGAKNSTMYRSLPVPVSNYLEEDNLSFYRERLSFIHSLLEEAFTMDLISQALEQAQKHQSADKSLIRHLLYQFVNKPLKNLKETYTPDSVKQYKPRINAYERLMPRTCKDGGETDA